jgi:hypothetical protein
MYLFIRIICEENLPRKGFTKLALKTNSEENTMQYSDGH